jgi:hypothetical protein
MAEADQGNVDERTCRRVREIWEGKTGEWLSKKWDAAIAKWITEFEFSLVIDAISAVVGYAHRFDATLPPSKRPVPSILDVPKFAFVLRADEKEPGMLDCYLLRGRIMTKFLYVDPNDMITILAAAMRGGMSIGAMRRAVDNNETLEGLCTALGVENFEYQEMFCGPPTIEQKECVYSRRSTRVAGVAILFAEHYRHGFADEQTIRLALSDAMAACLHGSVNIARRMGGAKRYPSRGLRSSPLAIHPQHRPPVSHQQPRSPFRHEEEAASGHEVATVSGHAAIFTR